ncbi:MAG: glycosyltransferase family 4 protein, partial [Acidobacteria bacterium]|nr:glycosyltransferase family 4 protein [Acidobacteriota bacterium]
MKIAFVVQRYGTEILGGSEYHCRLVAERLADRHQVDVLTTCARDYTTWENVYPEGADRVRGVTVRRFATSCTRNLAEFNAFSDWIFHNRHTRQDEMEWLKQQGPWSPALIEYLERHHQDYDILIFFTYLYAPTVLGLKVAPSKSLLVPTAHDEPAIRLGIYEDVFSSAAGLVWNTDAERRFVSERFHLRALVEDVVGCGVDVPESRFSGGDDMPTLAPVLPTAHEPLPNHLDGPANAFKRRHRMHGAFALYGGRIDPGKGCEELLEYFQAFLHEGGDASLMLMGVKLMPLPDDPHVRFAGILPDEERLHALDAATVVVVPSPHESLSLLALEAFAVGTPVLANGRSEVLVDHCRRSNAGLYYEDRWEFVDALKLLTRDAGLRAAMGRNGQAYVNANYRWDII